MGRPFFKIVSRSRSCETLSKAPARSRLRIETTFLGSACQAALASSEIKEIAVVVDLCLHTPNWVGGRSECSSKVAVNLSAINFSSTLARVFSRAIGR